MLPDIQILGNTKSWPDFVEAITPLRQDERGAIRRGKRLICDRAKKLHLAIPVPTDSSSKSIAVICIVSGSIVALLGGILLIGLIARFGLTPLGLFIPFSVLALGQGLSIPQAQASAIALEPALTGTASGIVVFLQLLFAAVFPQLVATLWGGTLWPMASVVGTMALLSALCGVGAVMLARRSTGGT